MRTRSMWAVAVLSALLPLSQAQAARKKVFTIADEGYMKLRDLKVAAVMVADEAEHFRTAAVNSQLPPDEHILDLEQMKAEINRMGREIAVLDAEKDALPAWEQRTVAATLPLLKDMALATNNEISFLNENRNHLWASEYRATADRLCDDSSRMAKTLRNSLKLAKVRDQERNLESIVGAGAGQ